MVNAFFLLYKPENYPPMLGTTQKSSQDRKFLAKSSTLPKIHLHIQGDKKVNIHGSTAGLHITDNVSVDRLWICDGNIDTTTGIWVLQDDRKNQPQGKSLRDGGGI